MPSPFPGMDPYLEGSLWLGFHGDLCTEVKRQLAPRLEPRYYPFSKRYIVMETVVPVPIPHYRIEIRDVESRELVTAIEFLSPTNKKGKGRRQYLRKGD